jgi:hypothetical protein
VTPLIEDHALLAVLDNLILGCFYDGHLLDMQELGVTKFKSLGEFKNEKVRKNITKHIDFPN